MSQAVGLEIESQTFENKHFKFSFQRYHSKEKGFDDNTEAET